MASDRGIAVVGTSEDILKSLAEELSTQDVYDIDNKYYSASIPIRFDTDVDVLAEDVCQSDEEGGGLEALVVVIDATTKEFLFDQFAPWWEANAVLQGNVQISLVFCRDMTLAEHGSFLVRAHDWCVDQGFELIEGQRYDEQGIADRETGLLRLEEALQAHMWPGAVMKKSPAVPRVTHGDSSDDDDDDDDVAAMEAIFRRMAELSQSGTREDKLKMIEDVINHLNLDDDDIPPNS